MKKFMMVTTKSPRENLYLFRTLQAYIESGGVPASEAESRVIKQSGTAKWRHDFILFSWLNFGLFAVSPRHEESET